MSLFRRERGRRGWVGIVVPELTAKHFATSMLRDNGILNGIHEVAHLRGKGCAAFQPASGNCALMTQG